MTSGVEKAPLGYSYVAPIVILVLFVLMLAESIASAVVRRRQGY